MQEGSLLHRLGHDMLVECMRHLTCTADRQGRGRGDKSDNDAQAGCAAASCRALLHATLGSGVARLRLDLGTADMHW